MKRSRLLIFVNSLLLLLLVTFTGAAARTPTPQIVTPQGNALGTAFTYQGQLKKSGQPFTGTCDFQFSLHGAASAGAQIGEQLLKPGVEVKDSVFAVQLDFGANVFTGQALWLQAAVKCPGDDGFVIFSSRQELTPTPYALGLRLPLDQTTNSSDSGLIIRNTSGRGIYGISANGTGVEGMSDQAVGVVGISKKWRGVVGVSESEVGVAGESTSGGGVLGVSKTWHGAVGISTSAVGVYGESTSGVGVHGISASGDGVLGIAKIDGRSGVSGINEAGGSGVYGRSVRGAGVYGESNNWDGVYGLALKAGFAGVAGHNRTDSGGNGVLGYNKGPNGNGVLGVSDQGTGVTGIAKVDNRSAVFGSNEAGGVGVHGISVRGDGVLGIAKVDTKAGVAGINEGGGNGVYGRSARGYAGFFDGKVRVSVLEIAGGADLAEPFDVASTGATSPAPGMVACIDPANPGKLIVCSSAYDQTVAGVISGAGGVQPGMVMQQEGSKASGQHPIALTGRVYVWVDATAHPVQPGDLLTTSATPGHAIKVTDYDQAHGAVIGKAMTALPSGKGLVLVLVSLN